MPLVAVTLVPVTMIVRIMLMLPPLLMCYHVRREAERTARQASLEEELIREAAGAGAKSGKGASVASVVILTVTLHNETDAESSDARPLLGYSVEASGVEFSDKNSISRLVAGGLAARGGLLHVGDTVLAINGKPLKGGRVVHALNAKKRPKYELTVARSTAAAAGHADKISGEFEGWVVVVTAKDGKALSSWPRKHWMVLDGAKGLLHLRESSRSAGRHAQTVDLRGAVCKAPVMMLRGQELQQPPVIQYFITRRRFPFTLVWPDREVDHDIVLEPHNHSLNHNHN